jgi:enamine deaminase RidA (YjgF/YER057c/UK114 family)
MTASFRPAERRRHSSGGPWEDRFGYSRALRVGDRIVVSGCTAVGDDAALSSTDARRQAEAALAVALDAVAALGGRRDDVVRTRMYLTRREDADAVGEAHGAAFADVRPAATMVVVAGLIDERMLVEIELEAVVS